MEIIGNFENGLLKSIPETWSTTKGENVKVGIIDTGFSPHPDIKKSVKAWWPHFLPYDTHGHGTHVIGIIASCGKIYGVAPKSRIYSAKAIPTQSWEKIGRAISWCIIKKVDIINISFGTTVPPPEEVEIIFDFAYKKGIVIVASAGNTRKENENTICWPAKMPNVIPVAACDFSATDTAFSATGSELEKGFVMPGSSILSTWLNGGYAKLSGTSQSAAFVTGLIALIMSKHRICQGSTPIPEGTSERVESVIDHLKFASVNIGDPQKFGYGYLDASRIQ